MAQPLRMNQGDRTEGRIYFLPHFVAQRLGYFASEGVTVEFTWAEHGDYMAKSGQLPAVIAGAADLTVGGPMVTMRMQSEGQARLVNFCALVQKNPWFLATREPVGAFRWADLAGKTVIDAGAITTATLSLRWLLMQSRIDESLVKRIEPEGGEAAGIAAFLAGEGDYLFHSAHALGPYLADGMLHIAKALADDTGNVPWSAYITKPETLAARAEDFDAFVRAIGRALRWVAAASVEDIATLVEEHYPGYPRDGLVKAITIYKAIDVWAPGPLIPESEFLNFRGMLMDVGWFKTPVPYADQVPADIAIHAIKAIA